MQVHVVWSVDGPIMVTSFDTENTDIQSIVAGAYRLEFGEELPEDCSYELAGVFSGDITWHT